METRTRILVIARAGHFRDSLVALLRTIPRVDLTLVDGIHWEELRPPVEVQPDVVVIDLETVGCACAEAVTTARGRWASARYLALADNVRQARSARNTGVDGVLTKSTPAGELLLTIEQLAENDRLASPRFPPTSLLSMELLQAAGSVAS